MLLLIHQVTDEVDPACPEQAEDGQRFSASATSINPPPPTPPPPTPPPTPSPTTPLSSQPVHPPFNPNPSDSSDPSDPCHASDSSLDPADVERDASPVPLHQVESTTALASAESTQSSTFTTQSTPRPQQEEIENENQDDEENSNESHASNMNDEVQPEEANPAAGVATAEADALLPQSCGDDLIDNNHTLAAEPVSPPQDESIPDDSFRLSMNPVDRPFAEAQVIIPQRNIEADTQADTEADTQEDVQADIQADTQTDSQMDAQMDTEADVEDMVQAVHLIQLKDFITDILSAAQSPPNPELQPLRQYESQKEEEVDGAAEDFVHVELSLEFGLDSALTTSPEPDSSSVTSSMAQQLWKTVIVEESESEMSPNTSSPPEFIEASSVFACDSVPPSVTPPTSPAPPASSTCSGPITQAVTHWLDSAPLDVQLVSNTTEAMTALQLGAKSDSDSDSDSYPEEGEEQQIPAAIPASKNELANPCTAPSSDAIVTDGPQQRVATADLNVQDPLHPLNQPLDQPFDQPPPPPLPSTVYHHRPGISLDDPDDPDDPDQADHVAPTTPTVEKDVIIVDVPLTADEKRQPTRPAWRMLRNLGTIKLLKKKKKKKRKSLSVMTTTMKKRENCCAIQ